MPETKLTEERFNTIERAARERHTLMDWVVIELIDEVRGCKRCSVSRPGRPARENQRSSSHCLLRLVLRSRRKDEVVTAPDTTATTLDQALAHIAAEPKVWYRLAAARTDAGDYAARLVELVSGAPPPSWRREIWKYPVGIFASDEIPGPAVVDYLRSGQLQLRTPEDVSLLGLDPNVRWERRQSCSPAFYETLDWPATETQLSSHTPQTADPQGHLLSDSDAPTFLTFYSAACHFFGLQRQPGGGTISPAIVYRHQDLRGRINAVRIANDYVEVDVEGAAADGALVELAGDEPGPCDRVCLTTDLTLGRISLPLKEGLPAGSWLVLRRGSEWLDRRFLSLPYARGSAGDVQVVVEPGTRLEALVSSRERQHVEFKQQLSKELESRFKVMKTVCAFANGEGGSLLIGVDDDRTMVGVDEGSVDRLRDQLTQIVGTWVEPRPAGTFVVLPIADSNKVVLEYQVDAGTTLYGCGRAGEPRTPYVRHHGITEKATVAEITAIVQARNPTQQQRWQGVSLPATDP